RSRLWVSRLGLGLPLLGLALWILLSALRLLLSALWLWLLCLCTSAAILLFRRAAGLRRARGDQRRRKVSKSRLADLGVVRGRTWFAVSIASICSRPARITFTRTRLRNDGTSPKLRLTRSRQRRLSVTNRKSPMN